MKTLKKLFCACLAVIMIVLSSFVGIFAEDDTTLTVSSNSASVGQTVELDVALSGNSGISFATLAPEYDEDSLELVGVKYNTDKFPGEERFDGTYARWKSDVKDNKENGLFLTLTFKILDTALAGKSEVSLFCPKGYISGENSRYTNVSIISGTIDIIPGTPTFEVSSDYALQGETVEVHVSLKNNPGIAAAKITPVYDETALELVSVLDNSYGYKGTFLKYNNTNSLKWISEGNEDNFENKRFVTYVFKVIDTLGAKSTDVSITYDEGSIVNSKNENIEFVVESGAVIFKETPYTLTVSSPEALPGETVEVDVSLKNNPGIAAGALTPVYDNTVLELIDVKLDRTVLDGPIVLTASNKVVFSNSENEMSDGVLFTLVFRVLPTAKNGESEVTLKYEKGDLVNINEYNLNFKIESGSVGINSPAIKVSSSEVIPGETFEVDVSLENNPGISAGQLIPVYDNTALELIDVKLNKTDFYSIIELTPSNKVVFAFSENKISNGVLFTLVFRVLDTAKAGTSEVTLSYDEGDIVNTNEDNIKFRVIPGTVEVTEPVLMVSSPEAMPGETVKVDVSLRDNPGILTTTLKLIYNDTELELLDVNCNNDLGITLSNKNTVMWFSKNSKNYSEDGVLFTLVFRVLDTAKAGRSEITLSYEAGGIINQKEEDINFIVESGAVNIIAVEPTLNMFSYMAGAEAGDTVECMVNLKNNPGIAAVQLTPMYDDTVFELTDVRFNYEVFDGDGELTESNKILWVSRNLKDNAANGTLLTLVFRVLDNTEVRSSEISVLCEEGDILNSNEDNINFDISSAKTSIGIVKIPEFKISSVYSAAGETLKVDVSIENNPGIFTVLFNPIYDENVLELIGIDYNLELFPAEILTGYSRDGKETFRAWDIGNRFEGCEKNCEDGVFMTLNFRVLDAAKAGTTEISLLSYAQESLGRENIDFNVVPGTVSITEVPYDLNGDGILNSKDLVRLMKYISADGEGIEIFADTDINDDGVTNSKDIVRLMKVIAMAE